MKDIYLHDFTDQEHEAIRQASIADRRSINSWCKLTLLRAIEGTTPITSNLSQGEVVIIQKRGNKGRFVNKGGK